MKPKTLLFALILHLVIFNCSKNIEYTETFKAETAGNYLYNQDDLIAIYYENNKLFLNWKGGKIEPVVLEQNEFFVAVMYKKFRFVQHPETKKRYLSIIQDRDTNKITYDYLKVPDDYKTPSAYLKEGNYDKALAGYLEIKKQDSTSGFINEWDFNRMGYKYMSEHEYEKAIGVLKLNAVLHPKSPNVYDSLAEAYVLNGDSLMAYNNYIKTLEMNLRNKRAQDYVDAYSKGLGSSTEKDIR